MQLSLFDDEAESQDAEYKAFTDKFRPKLTTDDCLTPGPIYEAVKTWACLEYGINPEDIVRPFWPGADYQSAEYKPGAVVLDNPPFSILTDITRWYDAHGVKYFLFGSTLTLFSGHTGSNTKIATGVSITYQNGARVNTSFICNLEPPGVLARSAPDLYAAVHAAELENQRQLHTKPPAYTYPPAVLTSAALAGLSKHGQALTIYNNEAHFCRTLDAQRARGKAIFGAGYILGTAAAARRVEADRRAASYIPADAADAQPITWQLSDREQDIIKQLDGDALETLPIERTTDENNRI